MRDFSSSPAWVISILLWVLLTSANRAIRMITGKDFSFLRFASFSAFLCK